VAAEEEADELLDASGGSPDRLEALVARRCAGEPLAWLVGSVTFCGETVLVQPGVYVPRWQSEPLALEAATRLPRHGLAVDLCTGSGAIAVVLSRRRPEARVVATEIDPVAVACARANGIEVYQGDMSGPLPADLVGRAVQGESTGQVDVVTAVPPYVPSGELHLLPRDVLAHEPRAALDGGADGTLRLQQAAVEGALLLRPGGSLLLELGGDEAELLGPVLSDAGYSDVEVLLDEDGDTRGVVCRR
jgi:release factor glutamine methyltransferase